MTTLKDLSRAQLTHLKSKLIYFSDDDALARYQMLEIVSEVLSPIFPISCLRELDPLG